MAPDPVGSEGLRYQPLTKVAVGGMATVFVGLVRGALGFRQLVAIKRPHPFLTDDPGFRRALLVEARLASLVRHANVVDVRDVEVVGDSIQLVMDYVEGATLAELIPAFASADVTTRASLALRIVLDVCAGLQAIHETKDESGQWLGLVHRDVSPQNVLVGMDGVARIADFGLAKSAQSGRAATATASLRGKLGYMAPELLRGRSFDRRADVFAMGVVAWEALATRRLFRGQSDAHTMERVLHEPVPSLAAIAPGLGSAFDGAIAGATAKRLEERLASVDEFATRLEDAARSAGLVASHADVAQFVGTALAPSLAERRGAIRSALERLERSGYGGSAYASSGRHESAEQREEPEPEEEAESAAPPRTLRVRRFALLAVAVGVLLAGGILTLHGRASRTSRSEPVASGPTAAPALSASAVSSSAPAESSPPSPDATVNAAPAATIAASFARPSAPPSTKHPATPIPPTPIPPKLRQPPPNPY